VPVPTSTLTSTTPGLGDNAAITSNIQFQDVVLKLEVIPLINADNEVNLIIAQTNDNIIGTEEISGNQVPIIATQEITTSVRVPNGSTIILGGLINRENERRTDGIPYVSKIPVIGPILGGSTTRREEKRELIVMIQPVVVEDAETGFRESMTEGMKTELGSDAYEMLARPAPFIEDAAPVVTPTPTPAPRKKSWFPWFGPKTGS
jgi:general secretion pathway protein D